MGLHPRQPSVAAAGATDAAMGAPSTGPGYDAHDIRGDGRWIVLVLAASGLAVALGVAFVWLHVAGPSDGARMQPRRRT